MTSSKSRLTQSKSKLATSIHTKTSLTQPGTRVADSRVKVTDSKTKVTDSKAKVTESKAKISPSKSKMSDSGTQEAPLNAPSTSPAKASQSAVAASESGAKTGLPSTNVGQSQKSMTGEREGEEATTSATELREKRLDPFLPTPPEGQPSPCSGGVAGVRREEGGEVGQKERAQRLAGQSSAVAVQLFAVHDQYEMR